MIINASRLWIFIGIKSFHAGHVCDKRYLIKLYTIQKLHRLYNNVRQIYVHISYMCKLKFLLLSCLNVGKFFNTDTVMRSLINIRLSTISDSIVTPENIGWRSQSRDLIFHTNKGCKVIECTTNSICEHCKHDTVLQCICSLYILKM